MSASNGIEVEIAFQYTAGYNENVVAFANNIHNVHGGTHLSAIKTSVSRVLSSYARKNNLVKGTANITGDDWREGLAAIVSDVCGAHDIRHRVNPTLRGALRSHYRWLKRMGAPQTA